ncbi:hypothetical protein F3Y22_tig00112609pilonHSYRG00083 [Hibiscus syriacus]|uniref:Uncharacterized protein n=1 Tax=Hibiscus syriacus TaxID=106335 RepID=A0A6A2XEA0_HIBSY|nr:hypothetical protein F3Y22_tig00112609pilonHSYRG00083 [Hibiscus syriacus]
MNASDDHYVIKKTNEVIEACYYVENSNDDPLWRDHSSLNTSLPFLLTQLFIVLFLDRLLLLVLRPLRQPPIVAHIICGVMLGPTLFAETQFSRKYVIPHKTIMVLETFANLALTYYVFLVGLEMDFSLIKQSGAQVISVTAAGIIFPLLLGFGLYFMAIKENEYFDRRGSLFWAIALTSTNLPDLTRILADLKLLRTNISKIAMSSAILSDLFSWLLLITAISIFNGQKYKTILATVVFVLVCVFALRPAFAWLIERTSEGEVLSDTHIWFIMAGILLCGLTTDACGSNSIVGAFMFGAILPQEEAVRTRVVEKLNDFVNWILMPLFFLINGLRSDLPYCSIIPLGSCMVLGLLMNTKGVLSLIILNTGRNIKALNNQTFPLMMLAVLVMSCLIEPIIAFVNKPSKKTVTHVNRSIKGSEPDTELRILACVHSMRNVMGTLSILNLSHGTKGSPLSVFGTHLIELSKRASTAMLIVHNEGNQDEGGRFNRAKTEKTNIIRAFKNFEKSNDEDAVTVHTMSVISPYATMHVDICSLAEDKCVNLILLPFHKEVKADGHMGASNSSYANVNNNVLMSTPCSVAMLVDRGISSKVFESHDKSSGNYTCRIAMLFVGGPDDREALAYACRMAGHPTVNLTVARFFPGEDTTDPTLQSNTSIKREKLTDYEYIEELKVKAMENSVIRYAEMTVHNGEETIAGIRALGDNVFDLYVVGRRQGEAKSPITEGLSDWGTCPELGALGDTLVSSNFALNASVLVVQHYISTDVIHEISDDFPDCTIGIGMKQGVPRYDF